MKAIRALRALHGRTQSDVAKVLGVSQSKVSRMESGLSKLGAKKIEALLEAITGGPFMGAVQQSDLDRPVASLVAEAQAIRFRNIAIAVELRDGTIPADEAAREASRLLARLTVIVAAIRLRGATTDGGAA